MTIATELQAYNDGLLDAYDAVDAKGGTIPANKNLDNLPTAIGTISGGGGGGDPLDPEQVYRNTRPVDWLVMPEIGENEDNLMYFLIQVDSGIDRELPVYMYRSGGGTMTLEFGTTDSSGIFTPNPALTTSTTNNYKTTFIPVSAFGNQTSDGRLQLICKTSFSGNVTDFRPGYADSSNYYGPIFKQRVYEMKGKMTNLTTLTMVDSTGNGREFRRLKYFTLQGTNQISNFQQMFYNCSALTAVPQLDTSTGTNFYNMFYSCRSLTAVPQLDTSTGTNFSNMFSNCYSLTTIPQLDTSRGTDFSSMFYNCVSLITIPRLDTANGTNFYGVFYGCYSLTNVPQLDTANGTNFSSMFSDCYSLTVADFSDYDFSHVSSGSSQNSIARNMGYFATIVFGANTFGSAGIIATGTLVSLQSNMGSSSNPVRVKIDKTDAMLPIATNATTLFGNSGVNVYVPDALLATYQADTKWATLGTRLKGFSDLPS